MVEVRAATLLDAVEISFNIRQCDIDEVQAATGKGITVGVVDSYRASYLCWVAHEDGELIAIFGLVPTDQTDIGIPWMLATDRLYEKKKQLIIISKEIVKQMHSVYPILTNFVDERNTDSINYLKWLGFEFPQRFEQYGHEGRPFWQFVRTI